LPILFTIQSVTIPQRAKGRLDSSTMVTVWRRCVRLYAAVIFITDTTPAHGQQIQFWDLTHHGLSVFNTS